MQIVHVKLFRKVNTSEGSNWCCQSQYNRFRYRPAKRDHLLGGTFILKSKTRNFFLKSKLSPLQSSYSTSARKKLCPKKGVNKSVCKILESSRKTRHLATLVPDPDPRAPKIRPTRLKMLDGGLPWAGSRTSQEILEFRQKAALGICK